MLWLSGFGRLSLGGVTYWLSIEVFDAEACADSWRRAHGRWLLEAAVTNGAGDWMWQDTAWGLVLEIEFTDHRRRDAFAGLPAVRAALDATPDPVHGLLVYPGRGGSAGAGVLRRPRPTPWAGHAALDVPPPDPLGVRTVSLVGVG